MCSIFFYTLLVTRSSLHTVLKSLVVLSYQAEKDKKLQSSRYGLFIYFGCCSATFVRRIKRIKVALALVSGTGCRSGVQRCPGVGAFLSDVPEKDLWWAARGARCARKQRPLPGRGLRPCCLPIVTLDHRPVSEISFNSRHGTRWPAAALRTELLLLFVFFLHSSALSVDVCRCLGMQLRLSQL